MPAAFLSSLNRSFNGSKESRIFVLRAHPVVSVPSLLFSTPAVESTPFLAALAHLVLHTLLAKEQKNACVGNSKAGETKHRKRGDVLRRGEGQGERERANRFCRIQ